MEVILWLSVAAVTLVFAWLAAPYHNRLIDSRPGVFGKDIDWD